MSNIFKSFQSRNYSYDELGPGQKEKLGIRSHNKLTGNLLAIVSKSFRDENGDWLNKGSAKNFLKSKNVSLENPEKKTFKKFFQDKINELRADQASKKLPSDNTEGLPSDNTEGLPGDNTEGLLSAKIKELPSVKSFTALLNSEEQTKFKKIPDRFFDSTFLESSDESNESAKNLILYNLLSCTDEEGHVDEHKFDVIYGAQSRMTEMIEKIITQVSKDSRVETRLLLMALVNPKVLAKLKNFSGDTVDCLHTALLTPGFNELIKKGDTTTELESSLNLIFDGNRYGPYYDWAFDQMRSILTPEQYKKFDRNIEIHGPIATFITNPDTAALVEQGDLKRLALLSTYNNFICKGDIERIKELELSQEEHHKNYLELTKDLTTLSPKEFSQLVAGISAPLLLTPSSPPVVLEKKYRNFLEERLPRLQAGVSKEDQGYFEHLLGAGKAQLERDFAEFISLDESKNENIIYTEFLDKISQDYVKFKMNDDTVFNRLTSSAFFKKNYSIVMFYKKNIDLVLYGSGLSTHDMENPNIKFKPEDRNKRIAELEDEQHLMMKALCNPVAVNVLINLNNIELEHLRTAMHDPIIAELIRAGDKTEKLTHELRTKLQFISGFRDADLAEVLMPIVFGENNRVENIQTTAEGVTITYRDAWQQVIKSNEKLKIPFEIRVDYPKTLSIRVARPSGESGELRASFDPVIEVVKPLLISIKIASVTTVILPKRTGRYWTTGELAPTAIGEINLPGFNKENPIVSSPQYLKVMFQRQILPEDNQ